MPVCCSIYNVGLLYADNTDRVVRGTVGGLFGGIGVVLFGALIVVVILYLCLHRKKEKLMKVHCSYIHKFLGII